MINMDLQDPKIAENFKAIEELRKSGLYSDEEIQQLYNRQVETDRQKVMINKKEGKNE